VIALAALLLADAVPTPCLKADETVSGEMRWIETRRAGAKSDLRFPFLVLEKPRCVMDASRYSEGRWVQLGLTREEMKTLVPGKTITVRAKYQVPLNDYQIGDILAMDAVIVTPASP
jgi:hypothetical protein